METYKNSLNNRKIIAVIGILIAILALVFALVYQLPTISSNERSFMAGFQVGILTVVIVMLGIDFVKSSKALKDETRLRNMYIEENDERQQAIDQKAGSIGMNIVAFGMSLATAIAGSFHETVFFTMLGATIFIVLVRVSLMLYYKKKY